MRGWFSRETGWQKVSQKTKISAVDVDASMSDSD